MKATTVSFNSPRCCGCDGTIPWTIRNRHHQTSRLITMTMDDEEDLDLHPGWTAATFLTSPVKRSTGGAILHGRRRITRRRAHSFRDRHFPGARDTGMAMEQRTPDPPFVPVLRTLRTNSVRTPTRRVPLSDDKRGCLDVPDGRAEIPASADQATRPDWSARTSRTWLEGSTPTSRRSTKRSP